MVLRFIDLNPGDISNRTGNLVRLSGVLYPAFIVKKLPIKVNYDDELVKAIADANLSIGNLCGIAVHINPNLLINAYLKKEAVLSSMIEGTRTTLSEVLIHEQKKKETNDRDLREVMNYIDALWESIEKVKTEPISEELIKSAHKILLSNVRGETKEPGKYKIRQNWFGRSGDILEASFIPCTPNEVSGLMSNLVVYLEDETLTSKLVKAGIMHYQFETIHPFADGNGRIGRLLIMVYLMKSGILKAPLLYLSAFFERYKDEYIEKLEAVSVKGDLEEWLKFFLKGVKTQADDALNRAIKLEKYREECRCILQSNSDSTTVLSVLDLIFRTAYVSIPQVAKILKTYYPTAKYNVDILVKNRILVLYEDKPRGKIYYAPKVKEILTE